MLKPLADMRLRSDRNFGESRISGTGKSPHPRRGGTSPVDPPVSDAKLRRHSRPSTGATHTINAVMTITQTTLMIAPGKNMSVIR